jgi:hypothetical protein
MRACRRASSCVGVAVFCVMLSYELMQSSSQSVCSAPCVQDRLENYRLSVCQRVVISMLPLS